MLTLAFILSLPRTYWGKLRLMVYVSCSRSHSQEGVEIGFESKSVSKTRTRSRFFKITYSVNLSPVLRARLTANVTLT